MKGTGLQMRLERLLILMGLVVLLAAACGTAATPVPNMETREALAIAENAADHSENGEESEGQEVAVEPTITIAAPTFTAIPPTATPTEAPATAAPTEAPSATANPIVVLVNRLGDPANGATLFNQSYDTALGAWICSQCHNANSEDRLIGPGLLNLRDRAGERIEGEPAEVYVYNSIIHPNDFIVPGDPEYPENLMPSNYAEIFSEQELYDLVAYLLSLQG